MVYRRRFNLTTILIGSILGIAISLFGTGKISIVVLMTDSKNMPNNSRRNHSTRIPNDLLNDLSSRFIINIPEEERSDLVRLCFQIELAHWFYLDRYCEEDSKLERVPLNDFIRITENRKLDCIIKYTSHTRSVAKTVFKHIPCLQKHIAEVDDVIKNWRDYKKNVPTFGAILLDKELKHVLLVQGYVSNASWGFPKGKVNQDESPVNCAIREVLEETGFDITNYIDEKACIHYLFNDQLINLYIVHGISKETKFQPQTKNEIKDFKWFPISDLPMGKKEQSNKASGKWNFFLVAPFLKQLKKWIERKNSNQEKTPHLTNEKSLECAKVQMKDCGKNENPSPAENRVRQHKSTYSPPPRMLRQRSQKHSDENEKNLSQIENKVVQQNFKKNTRVSPKLEKKKFATTEDGFCPISKTWLNISIDSEALIALFSINLRRMSTTDVHRS
ncbi:m7GpppN-mRNA hydrolase [Caerostris darwini]|uniref:mRNA-decapping enzyme 2 n=1 Tax=Caerostris darwini TaxID=1538125 RepID=A0AAV4VYL4_9ARAC|nr:m7GpppN-mRNA hydrolase [Caerostris darwini]